MRLEMLHEQPGLPRFQIPSALAEAYGGDIGFAEPRVIANFVASVDGVVALPAAAESGGVISQGNQGDKFVMGLLRACAGAVLVGAGTFRKGTGLWDAESVYPGAAAAFFALREQLGLPPRPYFAVVTDSGDVDLAHPALQENAIVVTTRRGEARLGRVPDSLNLLVARDGPVKLDSVLAALQANGARLVLCEGGPTLIGQLIREGLLDELFLTRAPSLFGRRPGDDRKALVEGSDFGKGSGRPLELQSLRKLGSYLYLRYSLP
jgi:riboflavin biosynthesis pyrimidine reductase